LFSTASGQKENFHDQGVYLMPLKLKPLHEQVIFITGATSGIGLATVHLAVEQGAKVFMTARNEEDLQRIQDEMRQNGYDTAYAVADVGEIDQLQFAADQCVNTFGRIDTFVNNAGITIYSKLLDTTTEEAKRLFDTNFWGVVNGCKVAVPIMKDNGGVIINMGSVLSRIALPIQGIYSASKHAVKAYTDSLRAELMAQNFPLQLTLILPSSINTPYVEHARSHIGEPRHSPPVYATDVVARAILRCAVRPTRELGIGAVPFLLPYVEMFLPKLYDRFTSRYFREKTQQNRGSSYPREHGNAGNLFAIPSHEGHQSGHYSGHVMKSSLLTELSMRKRLVKGSAFLAIVGFLFNRSLKPTADKGRKSTNRLPRVGPSAHLSRSYH
jgi:NADP-dependent 3-hydroxy acid dehydrogenase YdfG